MCFCSFGVETHMNINGKGGDSSHDGENQGIPLRFAYLVPWK